MENPVTINIAFNLTNPLHDLIVKNSLEIRDKYGSDWYIDENKYHLHFPMYLISIPEKNIDRLNEYALKLLTECRKIDVVSNGLFYNHGGLIMIRFDYNQDILNLHEKVVEIFNPLREGFLRDKYRDPELLAKLGSKERQYLQEYGSQYVFENYEPHVTIARVKDMQRLQEIIRNYDELFRGVKSCLDRLQIQQAIFSQDRAEDRTVLVFDQIIES